MTSFFYKCPTCGATKEISQRALDFHKHDNPPDKVLCGYRGCEDWALPVNVDPVERLVTAAKAYLDHREKYGKLPATDESNHEEFKEFMLALIAVCPDGWNGAGNMAKLIVTVSNAID